MKPLRFTAEKLLENKQFEQQMQLLEEYENTDLFKLVEVMGIGGPYKRINSWEAEDFRGGRKLHVSAYGAAALGELYPPLVEFVQKFLTGYEGLCILQTASSKFRAALAANLIQIISEVSPKHKDSKVFFVNSGTEAVECALKMVRAHRPKAKYLISFSRSFHGKTLGSLSVTNNKEAQDPFKSFLIHERIVLPYGDAEALANKVQELGSENIVAIIVEPVQGEGGVNIPKPEFFKTINEVTKERKILLICDEIILGLGRSGYWFSSIEWAGLNPDIITISKPLGGGLTAIGATIAKSDVYDSMLKGVNCKTHSSTFGGNGLATAIGLKSVEIIAQEGLVERSNRLAKIGKERLEAIAKRYPEFIQDVRCFGMMFGIEVRPAHQTGDPTLDYFLNELVGLLFISAAYDAGLIVNFSLNSSRTIRFTPALNIPDELYEKMFESVELLCKRNPTAKSLLFNPVCEKLLDYLGASNPDHKDTFEKVRGVINSIR